MRNKEKRNKVAENFIKKDEVIIKKLENIFKQGYLPSREYQSYMFSYQVSSPKKKNYMAEDVINCFGHAIFNLTNEQLKENNISATDTKIFWHLGEKYGVQITDEIFDLVRATGLYIEECSLEDKMKENEWKIAFYTDSNRSGKEYHFLRQEKDGTWTGKNGETPRVEIISKNPPKRLGNKYILYGFYRVGNPNAVKTKETKNAEKQK